MLYDIIILYAGGMCSRELQLCACSIVHMHIKSFPQWLSHDQQTTAYVIIFARRKFSPTSPMHAIGKIFSTIFYTVKILTHWIFFHMYGILANLISIQAIGQG